MRHPLYIAFVWHMHQPYYLDRRAGEFVLPWVRLHATKDYLHMVEVLEDYPDIHATFNMVPSLVEQLQEYVSGSIRDRAWNVGLHDQLTREDKDFIDSLFFSANREKVIEANPSYRRLWRLREEANGDLDLLSDVYWRDLIAWFNLSWIDLNWRERDPVLRTLAAKGSHFTRDDAVAILEKQREIMSATLGAYRRLQRRGQVELSVSPYYHPILPLLIDSSCASEPSPWIHLPTVRFQQPEDALAQLESGIKYHEEVFARAPVGLWPSEGSVSQALVDLLAQLPEIRWLAADEAILGRSLGRNLDRNGWGYLYDPRFLYQPYWVRSGEHRKAMVFRDHYLSDRIGFAYQGMTGRQAAEDLIFRFASIHEMVKDDPNPYLVSIILDGENCWEHYEQNGETFLRLLYELLSQQSRLRTVTVGEFLNRFPPRQEIPRLATGSWINGNLETWIGENAQNRAWEYLYRAREALAGAKAGGATEPARLQRADEAMMAAEGSDWFWWYYSHNVSDQDELFDRLFRGHLSDVYESLGLPEPDWLGRPIIQELPKLASRAPMAPIHPPLVGGDMSPAPWADAGYLDPRGSTGSMQQGSVPLKRLYFGYDDRDLFLRIESHSGLHGHTVEVYVAQMESAQDSSGRTEGFRAATVAPASGSPSSVIAIRPDQNSIELRRWQEDAGWIKVDGTLRLIVGESVLEAAVSLEALGAGTGAPLGLSVVLFKDALVVQRLPEEGQILVRPISLEPQPVE